MHRWRRVGFVACLVAVASCGPEARQTATPTLTSSLGTTSTAVGAEIPQTRCWVRDVAGTPTAPEDLKPFAGVLDGPMVRVGVISNELYAVDALSERWEPLNRGSTTPVPTAAAVTLGHEVYGIDPATVEAEPTTVAYRSGDRHRLDSGEWRVRAYLSPLGTLVLGYGDRPLVSTADTGEIADAALLAIDPGTRTLAWVWNPAEQVPADIALLHFPIVAFTNPARDRALLLLVPENDTEAPSYALFDEGGRELSGWPNPPRPLLPSGAIAQGWFADRMLLYALPGPGGGVFVADIETGVSTLLPPVVGVGNPRAVLPLGDGKHLLVSSDRGLFLIDLLGDTPHRAIAGACDLELLGDPGWTSS